MWLALAAVALCAVIGVDLFFIFGDGKKAAPAEQAVASAATSALAIQPGLAPSSLPPAANGIAPLSGTTANDGPIFDEDGDEDGKPSATPPKRFATVQEAAIGSCSTISVEGLSRQIVGQARCINPRQFVELPARPNLVFGSHVFPYMAADARDHLLRALKARPNATLQVNSALRTVAQQYLVWRWSQNKRCGVQLATPPGESNHELGLALDIADHAAWRPALEAQKFRWLGASDLVHFDFKGPSAAAIAQKSVDVLAFQKLWNRNRPKDKIAESGRYDAGTEQRLKTAPAEGFPLGPSCEKSPKGAAKSATRPPSK